MSRSISIFADASVGLKALQFLLNEHPRDITSVVVNGANSVVLDYLKSKTFDAAKIFVFTTDTKDSLHSFLKEKGDIDYIVLAWWPHIIKDIIISFPGKGVVNFHPSLLPYNRGKHYNFWTIVEDTPFGVSLHMVDNGIDSGDILFQKAIPKSWEDTGETLYLKAQLGMIDLFEESYDKLMRDEYQRKKQDLSKGTFHLAKELEPVSIIDLDKSYKARDLINLIRARTFAPHPACRFRDESGEFEIRSSIIKIK
jgi:methionyl-tRNA formyltransferase